MVNKISGKQIQEVINSYNENESILETAKATGVSTVKVRKILITEGLWQSETSIKIGNLLTQGLTTKKIADTLYMSVKNVQAYMPYERGNYGENQSLESVRAKKYRKRMKTAAIMQVNKKFAENKISERAITMKMDNIIEFGQGKKEKTSAVLKLHLELDMQYVDDEERQILKKYGLMKNSISRDVLVPANITLHALNYAILRMFGWQNGHLHNFSLPQDVFEKLTDNQFVTWAAMAGVYFRFPTEDFEDIYWDDDYAENQSVKSWMKKKYTGPYKYNGFGEHYLNNQIKVNDMLSRWKEITVREFDFDAQVQPEPYNVKLKEATVDQVMNAFSDMVCYELLERLPIIEVLRVKGMKKIDFAEIRAYLNKIIAETDVDEAIEQYNNERFKSMKKEQEYLIQYDIPVLPVTEHLCYSYDYGDGWKVLLTCEDAYRVGENGAWVDINGESADVPEACLNEVVTRLRPICFAKDGIELVDDVGGVYGFCEMLRTIYDYDSNDEEAEEERKNMLEWADMMGWTGRKISPKQTL